MARKFSESHKSLKHELGVNLKILLLFVTLILLALWQHPGILCKKLRVQIIF